MKERLISALIGILFLTVFQPFGLPTFGWMKWVYYVGFLILITLSCVLAEYIVRYIFCLPPDEDKGPQYNVRRGIVFQLVNITIMPILWVFYLHFFLNNETISNQLSWHSYFRCLTICAGVSFIIGLYWRNVYMKRHYAKQLAESQLLNGMLIERQRMEQKQQTQQEQPLTDATNDTPSVVADRKMSSEELVHLEGSTKENVTMRFKDFIYAEAQGNYVSINYLEEGVYKKTLMRISIKNVAASLCQYADIIQCHRAYIANLHFVEKVEGRSSGISLLMRHTQALVPVSKSNVSIVKEQIRNPLCN